MLPTVQIDGRDYVPADQATGRFGVAITTFGRPKELQQCIESVLNNTPPGTPVVVVDDHGSPAATVPDGVTLVRNETNGGIAVSKNRSLAELKKTGVEHYFLMDDDTLILDASVWEKYMASPEPHLMAIYDKPAGTTKRQVEVLYEDDGHVYYHATRGYFLYVEARVVDEVGGMDPEFGQWGWEHMSWSDRIHSAGFTSARYMDIKGSSALVKSLDQSGKIVSKATEEARRFSSGPGLELRMESRNSGRYIEYRDLDDVILTSMLCDRPDPQRGTRMDAKGSAVKKLHDSVKGHRLVVLSTGMTELEHIPNAEVVDVLQSINPYFQRWLSFYQWLRGNPGVGRVWCVDATDVQMVRDPFPEMESGVLYFGYEPTTLRDEWMLKNHPDTTLQDFMADNPNLPLLNMGVVGGDRATVMSFAQKMSKFFFDDYIDFIFGWETKRAGVGDMAAGNYVARTEFGDVVDSGAHVTNVFKSDKVSPTAWWKHK